jgi:hypothetical protein
MNPVAKVWTDARGPVPGVSTRQAFDVAFRRFAVRLHAMLRDRCFLSGSYVLQLPAGSSRVQAFRRP